MVSNNLKYRVVIIQENDDLSWRNIIFESKEPNHPQLEKEYEKWKGFLDSAKDQKYKVNGKPDYISKLVDVHKQMRVSNGVSGRYKWKDCDSSDYLEKSMRYIR
jgi:hypothetical protein